MEMGRIRLRWHQVWGPMDLTVIVMKEAYCLRPWSCGLLVCTSNGHQCKHQRRETPGSWGRESVWKTVDQSRVYVLFSE